MKKLYYDHAGITIYHGHVLGALKSIELEPVQMCVTSPPYWGLRDYGLEPQIWDGVEGCGHLWGDEYIRKDRGTVYGATAKCGNTKSEISGIETNQGQFCQFCGAWQGSLGLEPTPELYVNHLVQIFREVRRVLRKDGTLWLNLGDSYMGSGGPGSQYDTKATGGCKEGFKKYNNPNRKAISGLKPKDLCMIPARVALALQADGWLLRSDIIWNKPNPMPESVTDRPTKSHEYMFLLTKSAKYFYDVDAIREPHLTPEGPMRNFREEGYNKAFLSSRGKGQRTGYNSNGRNKRSVWTITTQPYKEAHFAVFPEKLIEPCIKAGSAAGDIVLDIFGGSMTTAYVAKELGRKAVMIELNEKYIKMGINRLRQDVLPFKEV